MKIPLVIIKTFEIQSCVRGFHFFQDSWQPKFGEIWKASKENEPSSIVYDRYAIAWEDKNGKTVGHVPRYMSKQMHFFIIKYGGRVEMKVNDKWRYSKDLLRGGLEVPCLFSVSSEHEKILHRFEEYVKMSCQRNENRIRK